MAFDEDGQRVWLTSSKFRCRRHEAGCLTHNHSEEYGLIVGAGMGLVTDWDGWSHRKTWRLYASDGGGVGAPASPVKMAACAIVPLYPNELVPPIDPRTRLLWVG
eukprot:7388673-Prymnesium_polylepis.1